jgi:hypothetical protein
MKIVLASFMTIKPGIAAIKLSKDDLLLVL